MTTYYFAYGSNLNQEDWAQWCREKGLPDGLLRFHSTGYLPDWDIAFTHRSQTRNGGVLDLKPRHGQAVAGVIFKVSEAAWHALDLKEGAPHYYVRMPLIAISENGDQIQVETYRVSEKLRKPFVAPNPKYVDIVREGLESFDLSTIGLVAAAENRTTPWLTDAFFVYGTLLRGESRFPVLQGFGLECVLLAQASGQLLDLGTFPGLVNPNSAETHVEGEFVRLRAPGKAVQELDRVEGFLGFGRPGSLFRRALCQVHVGEGRLRLAWHYRLCAHADQAAVIPSGDWRASRGHRDRFLDGLVRHHVDSDEAGVAVRLARDIPFSLSLDPQTVVAELMPLKSALAEGRISERKLAQITGRWSVVPAC